MKGEELMKKFLSCIVILVMSLVVITGCDTGELDEAPVVQEEVQEAETAEENGQEDAGGEVTEVVEVGPVEYVPRNERNIAVSLGWTENEAGQRWQLGFEESIAEMGGNVTFANASYDVRLQAEQIETFIQSQPDALIVVPAEPLGVSESIQRATAAGIPVFIADNFVPNTSPVVWVSFDAFSIGAWTMDVLAQEMGGTGRIGIITLRPNEFWNLRTLGALHTLETYYPDIEIVTTWDWDPTGVITPRMAIENMLTEFPTPDDINAIWCAWDGAAFEGLLATAAAGRTDILFTGSDGGEHAQELLLTNPQFVASASPMIFYEAYLLTKFMHEYLDGNDVPRVVIVPSIQLTGESLSNATVPEGWELADFDRPGLLPYFNLPVIPQIGMTAR